MVANAHQEQEPEGKRIFDIVYLAGLVGVISVVNVPPVLEFVLRPPPFRERCLGEVTKRNLSSLYYMATAFLVLNSVFTLMVSLRTRSNLKKLQENFLKNLPANNALTYLDTQILCFSIIIFFFVQWLRSMLFLFDIISWKNAFLLLNLFDLIFIFLVSLVFPVYIILKTRRYLPRLWDVNCPLIIQNNDFYSLNILQVFPSQNPADSTA